MVTLQKNQYIQDGKLYTVRKNGDLDIATINEEPSLTQQQFKESADINNIMKYYTQTGELPLSGKVGHFLDISDVEDYATSLQMVINAENAFNSLPSKIRTRFENDPAQLLQFLKEENNIDEAVQLGLLVKRESETNEIKNEQNANTNNEIKPS